MSLETVLLVSWPRLLQILNFGQFLSLYLGSDSINLKLELLSSKGVLIFLLLDKLFCDYATEAQIRYWKPYMFGIGHTPRKIKKIPVKVWFFSTKLLIKTKKKRKKVLQIIMFIIFWDFLMVEQILFSPQTKQSVIIGNKLVYFSCLTSCRTTSDLGSQQIKRYKKNLKDS